MSNINKYYVGDIVNVKANVSQGSKKINSHIRYTLPKFARWKKKNSKIEFIRKGQGKIRLCYHTTHCDFRRVQVVEKDEDIFQKSKVAFDFL